METPIAPVYARFTCIRTVKRGFSRFCRTQANPTATRPTEFSCEPSRCCSMIPLMGFRLWIRVLLGKLSSPSNDLAKHANQADRRRIDASSHRELGELPGSPTWFDEPGSQRLRLDRNAVPSTRRRTQGKLERRLRGTKAKRTIRTLLRLETMLGPGKVMNVKFTLAVAESALPCGRFRQCAWRSL